MTQQMLQAVSEYAHAEPVHFGVIVAMCVAALMFGGVLLLLKQQYNKRQRFRKYFDGDPENLESQSKVDAVMTKEYRRRDQLDEQLEESLTVVEKTRQAIRAQNHKIELRISSAGDFKFRAKRPKTLDASSEESGAS
ncbi:MAG: hypothetical protein ABSE91_01535 [Patescibacteria group bacterium]|jgi:hypothetical protein